MAQLQLDRRIKATVLRGLAFVRIGGARALLDTGHPQRRNGAVYLGEVRAMAIKRISRRDFPTPDDAAKIREIVAEMRRPEDQAKPPGAPLVIAQEGDIGNLVHYYVVWDCFQGVDDEVRSDIVFEAVKEGSPQDFPRLASTVGLTSPEAIAMGIPGYESELAGNR